MLDNDSGEVVYQAAKAAIEKAMMNRVTLENADPDQHWKYVENKVAWRSKLLDEAKNKFGDKAEDLLMFAVGETDFAHEECQPTKRPWSEEPEEELRHGGADGAMEYSDTNGRINAMEESQKRTAKGTRGIEDGCG